MIVHESFKEFVIDSFEAAVMGTQFVTKGYLDIFIFGLFLCLLHISLSFVYYSLNNL